MTPLTDAEIDAIKARAHKRFDWTILRLVADLRAARAELDRIKSHNGECGTCDGWHQCCNALGTAEAQAARDQHAAMEEMARADAAEARLAAVLALCESRKTAINRLGEPDPLSSLVRVSRVRAAALGEVDR